MTRNRSSLERHSLPQSRPSLYPPGKRRRAEDKDFQICESPCALCRVTLAAPSLEPFFPPHHRYDDGSGDGGSSSAHFWSRKPSSWVVLFFLRCSCSCCACSSVGWSYGSDWWWCGSVWWTTHTRTQTRCEEGHSRLSSVVGEHRWCQPHRYRCFRLRRRTDRRNRMRRIRMHVRPGRRAYHTANYEGYRRHARNTAILGAVRRKRSVQRRRRVL